jgi:hypothetical protein
MGRELRIDRTGRLLLHNWPTYPRPQRRYRTGTLPPWVYLEGARRQRAHEPIRTSERW